MEKNIYEELKNLTGPIGISLTNDYFFKAFLQKSEKSLKGLIASLLHYSYDDIESVVIINETNPGDDITDKTFILDVKVVLNNHSIINLEMQVVNNGNWPERSLSYLCRNFDNLNKGEDYEMVKPCIHIGFLDFTLFEDSPEFYSNYYMINEKNKRIFSDKFRLSVVDLTNIKLATKEDKKYGIDKWAVFFKSTTWEELKMLTANSEIMAEAVSIAHKLTADELEKEKMRYREETIAHEKHVKNKLAEQAMLIKMQNNELSKKDAEILELKRQLAAFTQK